MESRIYVAGNITHMSTSRVTPNLTSHQTQNIVPRKIALRTHEIYVLSDLSPSNGRFNMVLSYYIANFYHEEGQHEVDQGRLIACIAGIIANCMDYRSVSPWIYMINAFAVAGVELKVKQVTFEEFMVIANQSIRLVDFLDMWGTDSEYILESTRLPLILGCIIILSMVKYLDSNNYKGWFLNRVKGFSGAVGDTYTPIVLTDTQSPNITQLNNLHGIINANHSLRKTIFCDIVAIAKNDQSFIGRALAEIQHLCRGLEMNHLLMIDRFIFTQHPEFLPTMLLRGLKEKYASALATLAKLPAENVMYAKIFLDKDEAQALNRGNFEEAMVVATKIAQIQCSSFDNYYTTHNKADDEVRQIIELYFAERKRVLALGLGDNQFTGMSKRESEHYFTHLIDKLAKGDVIQEKSTSDKVEIILPSGSVTLLSKNT